MTKLEIRDEVLKSLSRFSDDDFICCIDDRYAATADASKKPDMVSSIVDLCHDYSYDIPGADSFVLEAELKKWREGR